MQLLRAAAHGGIVLLDKEPADFILRNICLLLVRDHICRSGGVGVLKVGSAVHGGVGGIESVRICRVVAVHRGVGRVGHGGGIEKEKEKTLGN